MPNDCGLHAIGNAITLALGEDPSQSIYNRGVMRQHLKKCLSFKVMSAFPKSNLKREKIMSVLKKIRKVQGLLHLSKNRLSATEFHKNTSLAHHRVYGMPRMVSQNV